jgi:hypothetical protein
MSKLLLFFAILFIFACSSSGDRCEDVGGCKTYNGYCVVEYSFVCIPAIQEECQILIDYLVDLDGYNAYFNRVCPSNYNSSPKACYYTGYPNGGFCTLIAPPGYISSERECTDDYHGKVMDMGTCERTYGIWNIGSCTVEGICYNNVSQYDCLGMGGSFNEGECPSVNK